MLQISSIMKKYEKDNWLCYGYSIERKNEERLWRLKTIFETNMNEI